MSILSAYSSETTVSDDSFRARHAAYLARITGGFEHANGGAKSLENQRTSCPFGQISQ
jgi:hypothetical protein